MWIEGMAKCLYHCVVGVCAGKQSNFSSSYIYIYIVHIGIRVFWVTYALIIPATFQKKLDSLWLICSLFSHLLMYVNLL